MSNPFKSEKFWLFVGGAATGLFVKSKACRKLTVNTIACGMSTRDKISAGVESMKEDANDIYEDAKRKHAAAADDDEPAEEVSADASADTVKEG